MDDLDFEPTGPVRVAGKFHPKAKPKSTKLASTGAASNIFNVVKEHSVPLSTVSDTATSVDDGGVKLTYPVGSSSATLGVLEPSGNNEHLCSSVQSFDADRITKPSESVMVSASNGSEGSRSVFEKSASENVDIFSGLECLDDFLTQPTSGEVPTSRKSPDKVKGENFGSPTHCSVESSAFLACDVAGAQTISGYCATQDLVSCTDAAMSIKHGEILIETKNQEFEALDVVSEAPISTGHHAESFQPKLRIKKGRQNPNIPHPEVESTTPPQPAHFETGEMDECSLCASPRFNVHNHISPTLDGSIARNPTPDFQENAESFAETTQLDEAVYGDAAHSEGVCGRGQKKGTGKASTVSNRPQKRKGSATNEEAKDGTLSRKSRKQLPSQQADVPGNNTNEDSFNAENSNVYDRNEDREHHTKQRKRAPRKSKIPISENEKPDEPRKRKRTKKAPDEPTKTKFSHSTRRNIRKVDKSLIETPEVEIDPSKIAIRDLIRLGEYREWLEAAKVKAPASNESANDEFHMEASHDEEENFIFEHRSSYGNQDMDRVSNSSFILNYGSYMNRQKPVKWSEQETELLYEGLEQFGSDFGMVALLFPGRKREHMKSKFKKEALQNPIRISEAFCRQSKDNSKYILVIHELQKVAREKQESDADELSDIAGQEQEVELTHT